MNEMNNTTIIEFIQRILYVYQLLWKLPGDTTQELFISFQKRVNIKPEFWGKLTPKTFEKLTGPVCGVQKHSKTQKVMISSEIHHRLGICPVERIVAISPGARDFELIPSYGDKYGVTEQNKQVKNPGILAKFHRLIRDEILHTEKVKMKHWKLKINGRPISNSYYVNKNAMWCTIPKREEKAFYYWKYKWDAPAKLYIETEKRLIILAVIGFNETKSAAEISPGAMKAIKYQKINRIGFAGDFEPARVVEL